MAAPSLQPHRPRWGHQTSLWQVREPAFWLFATVIAASLILQVDYLTKFSGTNLVSLGLSLLLMVAWAIPVFLFIGSLDLYEREPMSLLLGALLWGGIAAETLAIVSHAGWDPLAADLLGNNAAVWLNAVTAPPTEEILKALGVVLIYLIARDEMDDLLDGAIYGIMVGLGFHVVEDIGHFIGTYGGTVGGVLQGYFVRVIAGGPFLHMAWTGLVGLAIASFVTRRADRSLGQRVLLVIAALLVAMVGHALWNSPLLWFGPAALETFGDYVQIFVACVIKGIPFMVLIVVMLRLARAREHRWLRYALRDEVGLQALHQDELITLEHPKLRRGAIRRMTRAYGSVAGKALRDLQRAHIQLAMIRTRTDDPNHPDLLAHRRYIEELRGWLIQSTGHRGSTLAYPFQPPPLGASPSPGA